MHAAIYHQFQQALRIEQLPDPVPVRDGVVIEVRASGICRSDWHGWMGHDVDIRLPQIPGHEFAGIVTACGDQVRRWRTGDRVTVPFCVGCGQCASCLRGDHQVCEAYYQPGFTGPGSFAQYVAIPHADVNLVGVPDRIDDATAASLGCRFVTAFRAVIDQGRVRGGQWVAIHGCGGVGLSAIMIATAIGANVVAVDVRSSSLQWAQSLGARHVIDATSTDDVPAAVHELTGGGAHVSLDAFGSSETCRNSLLSLRRRGRHVQAGLLIGPQRNPSLPLDRVVAWELEILGTHGMSAAGYAPLLAMIETGRLQPERLIHRTVSLPEATELLPQMDTLSGITVITQFAV